MILHRHWMWANIIKQHFDEEVKTLDRNNLSAENLFPDKFGAYMSIWYGLLFGVLEEVKRHKISLEGLDTVIDEIFDPLRRFRNAVFHPQERYWSPKLFEIMRDSRSASKIRQVHSAIGKILLSEIHRRQSFAGNK